MRAVIAIDSLKGSLSSIEAGQAIAEGIRKADAKADVVIRPLADGREYRGGSCMRHEWDITACEGDRPIG